MKYLKFILLCFFLAGCDDAFFPEDESDAFFVYDTFYNEVDQHFSFFPYLTKDFDSAYQANRSLITTSPSNLTDRLQALIDFLEDGHTNVILSESALSFDFITQSPINRLETVGPYFDQMVNLNDIISYGFNQDLNLGYISINRFSGDNADFEEVDRAVQALQDTDGIVIDVRSNGGGSSFNADIITSRFNDEERFVFQIRRRNGGRDEFEEWIEITSDVFEGLRYLKPVTVLTNRGSYSATEWFVASIRTAPHVTIVGDTTGGGSGIPLPRDLPNGWEMRVSNSQTQLPDGTDYQFTGLFPDVPLWIPEADSTNGVDTILERAFDLLTE